MKQITIDIETTSDENIKDCGVYRYAESEYFDLLLVSYAVDNGPVATCDIANGETLPDDVRSALTDKTVIKKAFHVNFERICLSVYLRRRYPEMLDFEDSTGSYLDPVSWQCDMIHCRYLGMLSSLDDMGRLLRLKEKKMTEGKELIRFFCTLHQEADGSILFHDKSDAPKKWCSLPRKTQKTDTQNEKNAPEHHVQERFLLPINGVLPLFYPFNFSSILATCRKICLSVSLLLVSFSVSSFGLSVVVVAFFANPFSPAALMIAG